MLTDKMSRGSYFMNQVLLVEDDELNRYTIERILKDRCEISSCASLQEANALIIKKEFDLILLDVALPDGDGFQFLAHIRNIQKHSQTPVLFITGKSSTSDQVLGYSLGADDYIIKPIEPVVLQAKINSKLKRQSIAPTPCIEIGNLKLDSIKQKACLNGDGGQKEPLDLTPMELKLLSYFITREEHVISRVQLLDEVWGNSIHIVDRTIDTHISHLRKKLLNCSHTIEAIRGLGYRLIKKSSLKTAA